MGAGTAAAGGADGTVLDAAAGGTVAGCGEAGAGAGVTAPAAGVTAAATGA